jgi:Arc-like DNA binding domain
MRAARKKTDKVQLKLYVREDLRRKLEQAARRNARPMNAEMIKRLEESFELPPMPLLKGIIEAGTAELTDVGIIQSFLEHLREQRPHDAALVASFLDRWRQEKAKRNAPTLTSAIEAYMEKTIFEGATAGM